LALKMQCHVVNNTLLQTAFSAISPTGQLTYMVNLLAFLFEDK